MLCFHVYAFKKFVLYHELFVLFKITKHVFQTIVRIQNLNIVSMPAAAAVQSNPMNIDLVSGIVRILYPVHATIGYDPTFT